MHHKYLISSPLKTITLFIVFTGQVTFNVSGTIMHSTLYILLTNLV